MPIITAIADDRKCKKMFFCQPERNCFFCTHDNVIVQQHIRGYRTNLNYGKNIEKYINMVEVFVFLSFLGKVNWWKKLLRGSFEGCTSYKNVCKIEEKCVQSHASNLCDICQVFQSLSAPFWKKVGSYFQIYTVAEIEKQIAFFEKLFMYSLNWPNQFSQCRKNSPLIAVRRLSWSSRYVAVVEPYNAVLTTHVTLKHSHCAFLRHLQAKPRHRAAHSHEPESPHRADRFFDRGVPSLWRGAQRRLRGISNEPRAVPKDPLSPRHAPIISAEKACHEQFTVMELTSVNEKAWTLFVSGSCGQQFSIGHGKQWGK